VSIRILKLAVIVGVVGGLCLAGETPAAEVTAAEVLKKHVMALGGAESLKKHSCRHAVGTIEVQGLKGTYETWEAAPDKEYQKIDLKIVVQEHGYNGTKGWRRDGTGVKEVTGDALTEMAQGAIYNRFLHYDDTKVFKSYTLLGSEPVDGKPAHKIELVLASGKSYIAYFDAENFLQVRQDAKVSMGKNEIDQQILFGDFRKVDGITTWHTMKQITPFNESVIKLDVFEFCKLDDSKFAMPAAASPAPN
jgi:zinc protease